MTAGAFVNTTFAYMMTFPLLGPMLRSSTHNWILRLPLTLSLATFLTIQYSNYAMPNRAFTEIMTQPAPHGSYLRRTIKEHFPVWWNRTSAELTARGHSLPEMNEYDRATEMPKIHNSFNAQRF